MSSISIINPHNRHMTEAESNAFLDAIAGRCDTDSDFGERLDAALNLANKMATVKGIIVDVDTGTITLDYIKN